MKLNALFLSFLLLLLSTVSCDDDLNSIGMNTKPDRDQVEIKSDTIFLGEEYVTTIAAGPVLSNPIVTGFAVDSETGVRSPSFLLGSFYDPDYGNFKADFITAFSPVSSLFEEGITKIDTVWLKLSYHSWIGDSLAPMVAKAYPAKRIPGGVNYAYTDVELQDYAASSTPWATRLYTARDMSLSDSLHSAMGYNEVSFDITDCIMPESGGSVAASFFNKWNENPAVFDSISALEAFFPGVYVTTSGGSGSLLKIFDVSLVFRYSFLYEGRDSTATASLNARNDIVQACRYAEENQLPIDQLNLPESYIKSPAGVYTQYTIPVKKIKEELKGREINVVKLSVSAFPQEDRPYTLGAPSTLMLVRKDSLDTFFLKNKNITAPYSYKASYSSFAYNFGDISGLVRAGLKDDPEKDIEVVLVPIVEQIAYYSNYPISMRTAYDIVPSAVRLRTGKEHLRLEMLSSDIPND